MTLRRPFLSRLCVSFLILAAAPLMARNEPDDNNEEAPANFTRESEPVTKFGVHEISLIGDGSVANPQDTLATVRFGKFPCMTVQAFNAGENTWKARVYVSETGSWNWGHRFPRTPN